MKFQKMFLSAATGCLLVGASGAATAETVTKCPDGLISYATVDAITLDGQDCNFRKVRVVGNVTITNATNTSFTDGLVEGSVTIQGKGRKKGAATFATSTVLTGPTKITRFGTAAVNANTVDGNLSVNKIGIAEVRDNLVNGNLVCNNNNVLGYEGNFASGANNCP